MYSIKSISLLVALHCTALSFSQEFIPGSDQMLITHLTTAKRLGKWENKLRKQRLQLFYSPINKQLWLKAHPLTKIENLRFNFTLQDGIKRKAIKGKTLAARILEDHSALPENSALILGASAQKGAQALYDKDLNDFAAGKKAKGWIQNQWLTVADWDEVEINNPTNPTVCIQRRRKIIGTLTIDSVNVKAFSSLPVLSQVKCVPFDRFFELKNLKGYGIDKIKYFPFSGRNRNVFKKNHEVFFPKNKVYPEYHSIETLEQYLNDNNLSILRASLFGYSSLEGDSLLNRKLQEKRANYLYQTLNKISSDPVEADSIGFADGYQALVSQAKPSNQTWIDSLSRSQLRDTLLLDPQLLASIEPLLKLSRKAELQLVMAKRLSKEEQIKDAIKQLNLHAAKMFHYQTGQLNLEEQQRVSGIL